MPFSRTINNSILDHFTGVSTWTAPTAVYVGLSSTTPTITGTNVTEPSGGAYARVQVDPGNSDWNAASNSAADNANAVTFTQASADWVSGSDLTHLVYYDASTAGNFLGFAALTTAKPVLSGDTANFPVGDLDLTLNES